MSQTDAQAIIPLLLLVIALNTTPELGLAALLGYLYGRFAADRADLRVQAIV